MKNWFFTLDPLLGRYVISDEEGKWIAELRLFEYAQEVCESHNQLVAEYWDRLDE